MAEPGSGSHLNCLILLKLTGSTEFFQQAVGKITEHPTCPPTAPLRGALKVIHGVNQQRDLQLLRQLHLLRAIEFIIQMPGKGPDFSQGAFPVKRNSQSPESQNFLQNFRRPVKIVIANLVGGGLQHEFLVGVTQLL